MSKTTTLLEDFINKDDRLWNEIEEVLNGFSKLNNDDARRIALQKISTLTPLIHDNNYMVLNLLVKQIEADKWERQGSGNK